VTLRALTLPTWMLTFLRSLWRTLLDRLLGRCACQRNETIDLCDALAEFERIRERCPALRSVLVPDAIWQEFREWHRVHLDVVSGENADAHGSRALIALTRGHLHRTTSPIHRFMLDDDRVKASLTPQYRQDLQERWMLIRSTGSGRNQKFRQYSGKLAELQLAESLVEQGWTVTGLAATGGEHDIEAEDKLGRATALEVKYIGVSDDEFDSLARAMRGEPAALSSSPYQATNVLLCKLFAAATQFKSTTARRVAVVTIDPLMWYRHEVPIGSKWTDWNNAQFERPVEPQPSPGRVPGRGGNSVRPLR
jgi:hypothetical protein